MLDYKAIEIFTSEEARFRKKSISDAVIQLVRDLKIAARCIVTRGIAGCYESGETSSHMLEILSFNMPIRIYIVLPAAQLERVLDALDGMLDDCIVVIHDLNVLTHRARNSFFPRQLLVRDVMTAGPEYVSLSGSLSEAVRKMLSSVFSGLPVVDKKKRPVGVITQGDLIQRGGLPLRLGLLVESDGDVKERFFDHLETVKPSEVMTSPVVTIAENQLLTEAVNLMMARNVKRLPVVDDSGRLCGMLSRLDIFKTVMREAPDWPSFHAQKIEVKNLKYVRDIVRRDAHTVLSEEPVSKVIRIIDSNDIQRVVVVNDSGKLEGLISDRDLLRFFQPEEKGFWTLFAKRKHEVREYCGRDLNDCMEATKARDVMTTELTTIQEHALVEEAVALMTEKGLKRLPVIDEAGVFKGMISRDSLLRTGFGGKD